MTITPAMKAAIAEGVANGVRAALAAQSAEAATKPLHEMTNDELRRHTASAALAPGGIAYEALGKRDPAGVRIIG